MSRTYGVVELYNSKRGFGFLKTGKVEIYFSLSDWCGDLQPERGVTVSYEIAPAKHPKFKNQAVNIKNLTNEEAIELTLESAAAAMLAGKKSLAEPTPAASADVEAV